MGDTERILNSISDLYRRKLTFGPLLTKEFQLRNSSASKRPEYQKLSTRYLTHETNWVVAVGTNFVVDLDQTLHYDLCDLRVGEGILQSVTNKENQGK